MDTRTGDVRQEDGGSDRRWVLVTDDGAVSTVGRATDPSHEQITGVEETLTARGIGAWLAVQSHSFHRAPPSPEFTMVRRLGTDGHSFEDAIAAAHLRHVL